MAKFLKGNLENVDLNSPMIRYLCAQSQSQSPMDALKQRHHHLSPLSPLENMMERSQPSIVYRTPVRGVQREEIWSWMVFQSPEEEGAQGINRRSTPVGSVPGRRDNWAEFSAEDEEDLARSSSFGLSNLFSTSSRAPGSLYSSFKLCVQSPNPLVLHSDLLVSLPSSPFDPGQITQEKEGASSQDFFISSAENPAEFSRTTSLELTQLGMLPLIGMSMEMAINITS
ncbi:PREDICTED: mRNA decay activator ZFP36 [Prunus dulcis]|uniref:PREDICTED: mRNA decay activator ZFP36 n=1 Tax=Prunus dulcis TaxID=3755 RepID=A0A5E4FC64_PRUDU|nr:hypothetical protein L3X38_034170 [Prunus dulcis]VVA23318.1 PREDICTED: mRNA decay activator ZFP36 [Prunus dulcis]